MYTLSVMNDSVFCGFWMNSNASTAAFGFLASFVIANALPPRSDALPLSWIMKVTPQSVSFWASSADAAPSCDGYLERGVLKTAATLSRPLPLSCCDRTSRDQLAQAAIGAISL